MNQCDVLEALLKVTMGRRPFSWLSVPNAITFLMILAVVYILVANVHIGSSLRGLQVDSTIALSTRTQSEHIEEQELLRRTIARLEEEHKRLQRLVQQSESLIKKD